MNRKAQLKRTENLKAAKVAAGQVKTKPLGLKTWTEACNIQLVYA